MSPTPNKLKSILILPVLASVALLTWARLQEKAKFSHPPDTATYIPATPVPHFAVDIPQKALLKNYVTVSVKADPGIPCRLTFVPPSGEIQVMDAVADANGQCTWRWKLEESYKKGMGRLIFTINGVSDTHFLEILAEF